MLFTVAPTPEKSEETNHISSVNEGSDDQQSPLPSLVARGFLSDVDLFTKVHTAEGPKELNVEQSRV